MGSVLIKSIIGFLVLAGALSALAQGFQTSAPQTVQPQVAAPSATPTPAPRRNARPASEQSPAREPFDGASVAEMAARCVTLETAAGEIVIEMLAEAAPETVRNFLNLAATGAFNTTTFSRIVRDFVAQGGNLATHENLTPELAHRAHRTIPDEPNSVRHVRGIVSMARAAEPNTATTSFFILVGDAAHLDGTFAAFGRVTRGMDVVDAINRAPANGETPTTPVRIRRALVVPCGPTETSLVPGALASTRSD